MHTRTRQVQLAIQKAASNTRRTVTAVRSAIRHFLASLHRLVAAIAVGISVALSIIIVISLVAFVSGSAYGIFFAADAPNAASVTVREAVETLTEEYRDRLEEISDTVQYDRQDITANDDVSAKSTRICFATPLSVSCSPTRTSVSLQWRLRRVMPNPARHWQFIRRFTTSGRIPSAAR